MAPPPPATMVTPARPTRRDEPWELTGLDRANHFLVLRGTWLFEGGLDAEALKDSLAELLCHYPHLAGRMVDGTRVELNDRGVPFIHTQQALLQLAMVEADHSLLRLFHPSWRQGRVKKGLDAPLAVRLTQLADGQVLSVTATHAVMDGHSFYTMVHDWGRLHRGQPIEPPVLDQSLLPTPRQRSKDEAVRAAREAGWRKPPIVRSLPTLIRLATGSLTNRSRPIHLDDAFLARLRAAAEDDGALSDNDLLSAHTARCCARLYGHGPRTRCQQVIVLDGRRRLPGTTERFVGNAAMNIIGAAFPGDMSLPALARATHAALGPWLAKPSEPMVRHLSLARELMQHGALLMHFDISAMHGARPTISYINNFGRMPIYEVDFGSAEQPLLPRRVIPHDLPDPILLWPAPPTQGGLELYLTGSPDRAIAKLPADHPWWAELMLSQF